MKILELIKQTQEFLQGKIGAMQIFRPIKDIFDANSWRPTQNYFFLILKLSLGCKLKQSFLFNDKIHFYLPGPCHNNIIK